MDGMIDKRGVVSFYFCFFFLVVLNCLVLHGVCWSWAAWGVYRTYTHIPVRAVQFWFLYGWHGMCIQTTWMCMAGLLASTVLLHGSGLVDSGQWGGGWHCT